MKTITTICPVCRQPVARWRTHPIIKRHTDSTGRICPMSGKQTQPTGDK